jgi:hypothetical protein
MSKLLIDEENEEALLLERNGLLNNSKISKSAQEFETAMINSTSDLPLGKALNLLVNVHSHVLDKAISTIQESSPNELTLKILECKCQ